MPFADPPGPPPLAEGDWRRGLPRLRGRGVTLRNLRPEDAPSLFATLSTSEVSRFISPSPPALDGFQRFVGWALEQQAIGRLFCFAVIPDGTEQASGLMQMWRLDEEFRTAEWGFAIDARFWGTGLFTTAAHLVLDFAFASVGVERVEVRCAIKNQRASAALRKLGARPERVLPVPMHTGDGAIEQVLWTLTPDSRAAHRPPPTI